MSEKQEYLFKIILAGDGAVGKTSIRMQYLGEGFKGSYMKTIGADFASKRLKKEGHKITLQIFDLAGQDAYVTARKSFYKGGQAAFLVFDVTDPETLHNLNKWIDDCVEHSGGSIGTFIILGNKADLKDQRQVSNEMAVEFARQLSAQTGLTFVFLETSAKTGLNIDVAFDIMSNRLLRKFNVDIPLDLPDTVELIEPGEVAPASTQKASTETASSAPSSEIVGRLDDFSTRLDSFNSKFNELDNRVGQLEERLSKLAKIVKNLVQNN